MPLHSPVLQAVLDAIKGTIDTSTNIADHPNVLFAQMERLKLEDRAQHAGAALVSLQTAVKQAAEMFWPPQNAREEHLYEIRNGKNREYVEAHVDALIETLLPDPAGTTPPKTDDDDQARVGGDAQASLQTRLATLMQQWRSEGFDSAQYANQLNAALIDPK